MSAKDQPRREHCFTPHKGIGAHYIALFPSDIRVTWSNNISAQRQRGLNNRPKSSQNKRTMLTSRLKLAKHSSLQGYHMLLGGVRTRIFSYVAMSLPPTKELYIYRPPSRMLATKYKRISQTMNPYSSWYKKT